MDLATREAGAPAEQAAMRKINKQSVLSQSYPFESIAVENAGVLNSSATIFLNALGHRISLSGSEEHESIFFSNAFLSPCNVSAPFFYIKVKVEAHLFIERITK